MTWFNYPKFGSTCWFHFSLQREIFKYFHGEYAKWIIPHTYNDSICQDLLSPLIYTCESVYHFFQSSKYSWILVCSHNKFMLNPALPKSHCFRKYPQNVRIFGKKHAWISKNLNNLAFLKLYQKLNYFSKIIFFLENFDSGRIM